MRGVRIGGDTLAGFSRINATLPERFGLTLPRGQASGQRGQGEGEAFKLSSWWNRNHCRLPGRFRLSRRSDPFRPIHAFY